jgi:hypothetical protein
VNQLPVLERGRLIGVLTRERLLTLIQAGVALGPGPPRGGSGEA